MSVVTIGQLQKQEALDMFREILREMQKTIILEQFCGKVPYRWDYIEAWYKALLDDFYCTTEEIGASIQEVKALWLQYWPYAEQYLISLDKPARSIYSQYGKWGWSRDWIVPKKL